MDYLLKRQGDDPSFTFEVIVVNDGSPDGTSKASWGLVYVIMYIIHVLYIQCMY